MLTISQESALSSLEDFLDARNQVFVLTGAAGTGKTFLLRELAAIVARRRGHLRMMAPTGRAAKVLTEKTGQVATTVHKGIYSITHLTEQPSGAVSQLGGAKDAAPGDGFVYHYAIRANDEPNDTVYVIDEASMVSDKETPGEFVRFGSGRLLKDLFDYAGCTDPGVNRKIIFVGDTMQLPPVGSTESPALDPAYLATEYAVQTSGSALIDVVRQECDSTILSLANDIRTWITGRRLWHFQVPPDAHDFRQIAGGAIAPAFVDRYSRDGHASAMLVTHTNGSAAHLNRSVRELLFPGHKDPCEADRLVVIRNSYRTGLLNGDLVRIDRILGESTARTLTLRDKDGEKPITLSFQAARVRTGLEDDADHVDCLLLRSLLDNEAGQLSSEEQRALYVDFKLRHRELKPGTQAFREALSDDPDFNALQVKYGYAVTCHKAQGGEWPTAIVDFDGRAPDGQAEFLRWSYTAVTRAKKELIVARAPRSRFLPDIQTPTTISAKVIEDRVSTAAGQLRADGYEVEVEYLPYRVRWRIRREGSVAKLDTTYGADGDFNLPHLIGKSATPAFGELLDKRLRELLVSAVAPAAENPCFAPVEGRPFLTTLFEQVTAAVGELDVTVTVTHQQWRERYRFTAGHRWTEIDFVYSAKGRITNATVRQTAGANVELGRQIATLIDRLRG